jgi:hypothetical protein
MKLDFSKDIAFYRTLAEGGFFLSVLLAPAVAVYTFGVSLLIGRVHGIGAWVGMWRAGKLTYTYVAWMLGISIAISYWGLAVAPYIALTLITYLFFSFHYFFDEFELQNRIHALQSAAQSGAPFALMCLYLFDHYWNLSIPPLTYVGIVMIFLAFELIFTKVYNWYFVQMKITTLFILACVYFGITANYTLNIFLLSHYIFWFIYPVYNLNKYKPEERDSFIMIMLLLIATSFYYVYLFNSAKVAHAFNEEFLARSFMCGTLVHIFSTAPFGYLFGLPKPKYRGVIPSAQAHEPSPQSQA